MYQLKKVHMDQIDRKIVSMLGHDGRLSNAQMARELEVSEGTIRRRVKNLLDSKTISIVAASDPKKLGFFSEALIGVQCEPDKVTDISNNIASLEHTRWVIATTGSYDIFCLVALESSEELGNFIRLDIGSIEGIIRTETFVNLSVAKREYGD